MARVAILALLAGSLFESAFANSFSHPVFRRTGSPGPAALLGVGKGKKVGGVPITNDQNFWFANFTIGASANLEILIDTGSADAILNPGVYKPGSGSVSTGKTFTVSYGTTNPDGSGDETASGNVYEDLVSIHGANLSVSKQYLGAITKPTKPDTFPHDGLIGFASEDEAFLREPPWIYSVCSAGEISECRFGMALNTDGTGTMYYGEVPTGVFKGSLVSVPASTDWSLTGSVAANGKVVESSVNIDTDSGTTVIFGPTASVQSLFKAAGVQVVKSGNSVTGYYNCSDPPQLGFGFGGTIFNIAPEALAEVTNGDNCTASIHGSNEFGNGWLVGQAFFQGHYIDHNIDGQTMGFANLNSS